MQLNLNLYNKLIIQNIQYYFIKKKKTSHNTHTHTHIHNTILFIYFQSIIIYKLSFFFLIDVLFFLFGKDVVAAHLYRKC